MNSNCQSNELIYPNCSNPCTAAREATVHWPPTSFWASKNTQIATDLQASPDKSVHQADIRMRPHCLFPVVWQIWNKLLASCNKLDNFIGLVTNSPNKSKFHPHIHTPRSVLKDQGVYLSFLNAFWHVWDMWSSFPNQSGVWRILRKKVGSISIQVFDRISIPPSRYWCPLFFHYELLMSLRTRLATTFSHDNKATAIALFISHQFNVLLVSEGASSNPSSNPARRVSSISADVSSVR